MCGCPERENLMDPAESAARWRRWTVRGAGSVISQLLSVLDTTLPAGWKRLTEDDLLPFRKFVRVGSAWYGRPVPAGVGVALGLERFGEAELRGGWVWFAVAPNLTPAPGPSATWDDVMRFLDHGILPAARAAGADIQIPTSEEVFFSELPLEVGDRLRAFSHAARKSLPLSREEADRWREFVISVFRTKVIIDARPFTDWLVVDGWPRETAAELERQLLDDCLLLSRYADEVSAA
jgi:hypothetical protein